MPSREYLSNYVRHLRGPDEENNANVDASVVPQVWRAESPPEANVRLTAFDVTVAGATAGSMLDYGPLPRLSNGLKMGVYSRSDDELLLDLLDGEEIQSNGGWLSFGFDSNGQVEGQGGNAQTFVFVSYAFEELGTVLLTDKVYFGVELRDDFTGLDFHYFLLKGIGLPKKVS